MNCETAERLLRAYIDTELDSGLKTGLTGHLSDCPACARKMTLLKNTRTIFQKLGPQTAPADFELRLGERLSEPDIKTEARSFIRFFTDKILSYRSPVIVPAAGLAALLIFAAAISVSLRSQHGTDNFVESYFTDRSPYYSALTDKHDIPANYGQAAGTGTCAWSGCAGRS